MAHLPPTSNSDVWRLRFGPERVAAMVASVIVVLGGLGVASTMGASEGGGPRASGASGSAPAIGAPAATTRPFAATANPFVATANLALQLHERLAEDRQALETGLAATDFDIAEIVSTVRKLNVTARLGADVAKALTEVPGSHDVGAALVTFYESVAEAAEETLGKSVADPKAYRAAAKRLLVALEATASLQERLEALIDSARATGIVATVPTVTPTPSQPVASPTPTSKPATPTPAAATPARTPSPPAPPGTVPPSIPPLVGKVQNPGFEAMVPSPWALALESPAAATMTIDATGSAFEGRQSARIDITVPSDARTGISLRQAGIEVGQSHRYVCRVALRAAAEREVRVRVASASGATYGTRLVTVGPTWILVEFAFGSFVEDPSAVVEIDLGRSAITTWVDAVQITDVPESVP